MLLLGVLDGLRLHLFPLLHELGQLDLVQVCGVLAEQVPDHLLALAEGLGAEVALVLARGDGVGVLGPALQADEGQQQRQRRQRAQVRRQREALGARLAHRVRGRAAGLAPLRAERLAAKQAGLEKKEKTGDEICRGGKLTFFYNTYCISLYSTYGSVRLLCSSPLRVSCMIQADPTSERKSEIRRDRRGGERKGAV